MPLISVRSDIKAWTAYEWYVLGDKGGSLEQSEGEDEGMRKR